ncbi:MAG TPA: right-handed parallel beta-helix repeat-containing protein [bacterium]|nr:right-handed parallel beta-helix repeat-containing protein [bacterium]
MMFLIRICRWLPAVWLIAAPLTGGAAEQPVQVRIYVAPDGSDQWSGQRPDPNSDHTDGPFATLSRARNAIRYLRETGLPAHADVTVFIRGGVYLLPETFELTEIDSGSENHPITYCNYQNETVRITGGKEVKGWKPLKNPEILARLEESARDHVLVTDLKISNITEYGRFSPWGFSGIKDPVSLELFFQNQPMPLARWPNEGWAKIAGVPAGPTGGRFTYEGDRPSRWLNAEDIWLHGYWSWDWADSYVQVKSIDPGQREIITAEPHGIYGYTEGKRYYALNLLEELDQPGEWYLDRSLGLLYFWPPAPLEDNPVYISLLEEPLFAFRNASHIVLSWLEFQHTRGNAVVIEGGAHNRLIHCTLQNIGQYAVQITGGQDHGVQDCEIGYTGGGGLILNGGDRLTLTPGNHYAANNHIHHFGRWVHTYRPAIQVDGVGQRVSHNLIHDAPHTALALAGNEHIIEFNEIHHVCLETSDAGALYIGRDWTQRGMIIRHNYFHDLGGGDVNAVYLNDWTSAAKVFGNIFYKAKRGVLIGGGRDNLIENNIFVDCEPAVHVDARGLSWAKHFFDGTDTTLTDRMNEVHYSQPPYSERYPELLTLYSDEPAIPKGNVIRRNICIGGRWIDLLDGLTDAVVTIQDNWTGSDPGFMDLDNQDFRLKPDSPVLQAGFQPIPIDQIGPIKQAE